MEKYNKDLKNSNVGRIIGIFVCHARMPKTVEINLTLKNHNRIRFNQNHNRITLSLFPKVTEIKAQKLLKQLLMSIK